ncbi:hypothetical protein EGI32_02610 [Ferruginibacter sp. HRS2-29]|nr:hypothetical protein [Ferruginibacter sp. HRS2-29]
MYSDSALRHMATDNELIRLSQSEHPVLRSSAFAEMLKRKSFDQFDVVMGHLDDTAFVQVDDGEFGVAEYRVSDNILLYSTWESKAKRDETIEKVLQQHNYLWSAYFILEMIQPQEKYYSIIKNMATRLRDISVYGFETKFREVEFALYGLAKFKKRQDIDVIKKKMMENCWQLSHVSLRLIGEFPDTAYFDVLREYYRRSFFKYTGHSRNGFSGAYYDRADPEDFIKALVAQQSDSSAKMLDNLLTRLPLENCMPDKDHIIYNVIEEIWEHPCVAYRNLRKKIRRRAEDMFKSDIVLPDYLQNDVPVDTAKKVYYWWSR